MATLKKYSDLYKERRDRSREALRPDLARDFSGRQYGVAAHNTAEYNGSFNSLAKNVSAEGPVQEAARTTISPLRKSPHRENNLTGETSLHKFVKRVPPMKSSVSKNSVSPVRQQIRMIEDNQEQLRQLDAFQSQTGGGSYLKMHLSKQKQEPVAYSDKSSYVAFLEKQIEKLTANFKGFKDTQDKVAGLCAQVGMHEEKIVNISRLVKLLQTYGDTQEEDSTNIKNVLRNLQTQIADLGIVREASIRGSQRSSLSPTSRKNITQRVSFEGPPTSTFAHISLDAKDKAGLSTLVEEIDLQMKNLEARLVQRMAEKDDTTKLKLKRIQSTMDELQKKKRKGDDHTSKSASKSPKRFSGGKVRTFKKSHLKLGHSRNTEMSRQSQMTSSIGSHQPPTAEAQIQNFEAAINEWIDQLEVQVNGIENKIYERAYKEDLASLELKMASLEKDFEAKLLTCSEAVSATEKLANRFADDSMAGQEDIRQTLQQQEFRISEIFTYISQADDESLRNVGQLSRSAIPLASQMEQKLDQLEERVTQRIADSIESLGEIIKDQALKLKQFSDRLKPLERQSLTTRKPKKVRNPSKGSQHNTAHGASQVFSKLNSGKGSNSKKVVTERVSGHRPSTELYPIKPEGIPTRDSFEQKLNQFKTTKERSATAQFISELEKEPTCEALPEVTPVQQFQEEFRDVSNSPRSAFKRARDKSLKELSESFVSGHISGKISEHKLLKSNGSPAPQNPTSSREPLDYDQNQILTLENINQNSKVGMLNVQLLGSNSTSPHHMFANNISGSGIYHDTTRQSPTRSSPMQDLSNQVTLQRNLMINQKTGFIHEKSNSNEDLPKAEEAFVSQNFYDDDKPKNIQINQPGLKAAATLTHRTTSRVKSLGRAKSGRNSSMASLKERPSSKKARLRGSTSAHIPRKNLKTNILFSAKHKEEKRPKSLSKKRFPVLRTAATLDKSDDLASKLKKASKEVGRSHSAMNESIDNQARNGRFKTSRSSRKSLNRVHPKLTGNHSKQSRRSKSRENSRINSKPPSHHNSKIESKNTSFQVYEDAIKEHTLESVKYQGSGKAPRPDPKIKQTVYQRNLREKSSEARSLSRRRDSATKTNSAAGKPRKKKTNEKLQRLEQMYQELTSRQKPLFD